MPIFYAPHLCFESIHLFLGGDLFAGVSAVFEARCSGLGCQQHGVFASGSSKVCKDRAQHMDAQKVCSDCDCRGWQSGHHCVFYRSELIWSQATSLPRVIQMSASRFYPIPPMMTGSARTRIHQYPYLRTPPPPTPTRCLSTGMCHTYRVPLDYSQVVDARWPQCTIASPIEHDLCFWKGFVYAVGVGNVSTEKRCTP